MVQETRYRIQYYTVVQEKIQDLLYAVQDILHNTKYRIQDTSRIQSAGYIICTGYMKQEKGYRLHDAEYIIQDAGYRIQFLPASLLHPPLKT